MDEATRKRMVKACEEAWQRIAYDILLLQPNHSMTAEDARECTADYVEEPGWWDLTFDEHDECLAAAIPCDVCI